MRRWSRHPRRWWWYVRIGRRYLGYCTRTHHLAILTSGKGTYCLWHRLTAR